MPKAQEIITLAERFLLKLVGDFTNVFRTENNKVVKAISDKKVDTTQLLAQLNSIRGLLASQKPIESVSITNAMDIAPELNEGLQAIVSALKEELSKIDKEVVIQNDFKTLKIPKRDNKDIIKALDKLGGKLDSIEIPEMIDNTEQLIKIAEKIKPTELNNIERLLQAILNKNNTVKLEDRYIEKDRIKVAIPNEAFNVVLPAGGQQLSQDIKDNQINGTQKTQIVDSSGYEIGTSTNPQITGNYRYNKETSSWEVEKVTNIGVHLCVSDIDVTTGFVLIDLSDTTNFPHSNSTNLCIIGYQISINPDINFVGQILIGFLENVDATNGDFKPLLCWKLEKRSTNITDGLVFNSPICVIPSNFLVPGNIDDTTWQTDTALASPLDNTAPYTTAPGDGDLVMKVVRTAGEVNIGVTIKYFSQ